MDRKRGAERQITKDDPLDDDDDHDEDRYGPPAVLGNWEKADAVCASRRPPELLRAFDMRGALLAVLRRFTNTRTTPKPHSTNCWRPPQARRRRAGWWLPSA